MPTDGNRRLDGVDHLALLRQAGRAPDGHRLDQRRLVGRQRPEGECRSGTHVHKLQGQQRIRVVRPHPKGSASDLPPARWRADEELPDTARSVASGTLLSCGGAEHAAVKSGDGGKDRERYLHGRSLVAEHDDRLSGQILANRALSVHRFIIMPLFWRNRQRPRSLPMAERRPPNASREDHTMRRLFLTIVTASTIVTALTVPVSAKSFGHTVRRRQDSSHLQESSTRRTRNDTDPIYTFENSTNPDRSGLRATLRATARTAAARPSIT